MSFRTIDTLEAEGRRVLVRVDLNVPLDHGQIADTSKLREICPTLRALIAKRAKVIICSHLGRPKGLHCPELSLRPVAAALGMELGQPVGFADAVSGYLAELAVSRLGNGMVLMLENVRFDPREEGNDPSFARELANLADIYVNDAFAASHRAHASIDALARLLPAYAGLALVQKLSTLERLLAKPKPPLTAIVGGAKASTKLALLTHLVERADTLLIGGAMANTFLAAQGHALGLSTDEPDLHGEARLILARARAQKCAIILPVDVVVADRRRAPTDVRTVPIEAVPADRAIYDIGPNTIALFRDTIERSATVVWNGPLGAVESPPFDQGNRAVAEIIAEASRRGALVSVAGGGDTSAALNRHGQARYLTHVSTAGGAFLEWLEGRTLPGLAALDRYAAPARRGGPETDGTPTDPIPIIPELKVWDRLS